MSPAALLTQDPTWPGGGEGNLWYPHVYEQSRWDYGPHTSPLPTPASIVPEAFFDTILINGGIYPVVSVPPRRVRFRMLNGSQARFYHLNLYKEISTSGEADLNNPGPVMYQVGTEGGFLPAVAVHDNTTPLAAG